jgi:hypothetical protein
MSTHSSDRDDDEYLYEAASRYYNEKYSDWFKYSIRLLWVL